LIITTILHIHPSCVDMMI